MLENQIALVTGAAKGIGKAIAGRLAAEGCDIIINDVDEDSLAQTSEEIIELGRQCFSKRADVTNRREVEGLVQEAISTFGKIDILVNNAGGSLNTPRFLEEASEADWDAVVDTNLKGTFLFCKAVVPHMKRNGHGVIINISSIAAMEKGNMTGVQYSSAKAGILGLTKWLAVDLGPFNIRVNAIAPGLIISGERIKNLLMERIQKEERERMQNAIPLRRFGEPKDIAGVVCFLCSDDASYISGATIEVHGGVLPRGQAH